MITAYADLGNDATLALEKAILLYTRANGYHPESHAFATIHAIQTGSDGRAELAPGALLTRDDLEEIYHALKGKRSLAYLPPNVLACTGDAVAWHEPAQERTMFFQTNDESLNALTGTYPQPALLWVHDGPNLHVWALDSDARPTPDTPLYNAPYYNTYQDGRVCIGSMPLPDHHDPARTREVSDAFFKSAFTHPSGNHRRHQSFGGSHSELWQHVRRLGRFPAEYLAPTDKTLADVLACGKPH